VQCCSLRVPAFHARHKNALTQGQGKLWQEALERSVRGKKLVSLPQNKDTQNSVTVDFPPIGKSINNANALAPDGSIGARAPQALVHFPRRVSAFQRRRRTTKAGIATMPKANR
jgi:hypothetical protein